LATCGLWFLSVSAAAPAEQANTAPADLAELRREAMRDIEAGRFDQALAPLTRAAKVAPDGDLARARKLLEGYLESTGQAQAERQAERKAAVNRVKLARLAEKHHDGLKEQELHGKLYKGVEEIADAVASADELFVTSESYGDEEIARKAAEYVELAVKELQATLHDAKEAPDEWREAYVHAGRRAEKALAAYREAWGGAELPDDRQVLKHASDEARHPLVDMGVLVSRDPFQTALSHAREARELAADKRVFLEQEWVQELLADAERRGRALTEEGEWEEALAIYGRLGLSALDPDNEKYQDAVDRIGLHVRMITLYGAQEEPETETQPVEPPRWKEMIRGIDTAMVSKAISQIDTNYVKPPDYREIGLGALNALRVLAEAPQVRETFSGMADDEKRKAFLDGIERQIALLRREPTPDHLHVFQALNRSLELNADTVELPTEVVNMEFAEGMLSQLDKFTGMIWPYEQEEFKKRTMGSFFGIGVQIRKDPGGPIEVVTPLSDTPAFRAGIRAGDLIVRVAEPGREPKETRKLSVDQAVKLITGPKHTDVILTIERAGSPKPFDVTVTRDEIHIRTIKGWHRLPGGKWDYMIDRDAGIGYVRMSQFTRDTPGDLAAALLKLEAGRCEGLILDLRFNPGGLLDEAVDIADEFLKHGVIVSTNGRNVPEQKRSAEGGGRYQDGRVVVLVNEYSASAAEILAGALKDWGRATIVGSRSYGKGSVQRLLPLKNTSWARLKLTTAKYYLPSGRCLHRENGADTWGVEPDILVPATVRQTNRWAEIRQETDLLKDVEADDLKTLLGHQLREDLQLQTAVLLLRLHMLGGGAGA
jgi:carboxyl-terminal processing protease